MPSLHCVPEISRKSRRNHCQPSPKAVLILLGTDHTIIGLSSRLVRTVGQRGNEGARADRGQPGYRPCYTQVNSSQHFENVLVHAHGQRKSWFGLIRTTP